jgi:peptidoglycan/LPS O-acetylase OafA/YrhL
MELGPVETRSTTSNARFVVLDSWRGIAALAISAFHFRRTTGLDGIPLFDNLFLSVDFFFVLSGFVISSAYGKRLLGGFSICKFMWLRFGRVYPLHLAILLAFITMQMIAVYHARGTGWFPAPRESLDTVIGNLLLVHGLNVFPFLTWNKPSWSISVEFCTYIIFALTIAFVGRKTWLLALIAMVASPVFLFLFNHGQNIDATHTYGIVRSLYGFSVGILSRDYLS